jgi:hypothetical protein
MGDVGFRSCVGNRVILHELASCLRPKAGYELTLSDCAVVVTPQPHIVAHNVTANAVAAQLAHEATSEDAEGYVERLRRSAQLRGDDVCIVSRISREVAFEMSKIYRSTSNHLGYRLPPQRRCVPGHPIC